jgi:hypothetical protein
METRPLSREALSGSPDVGQGLEPWVDRKTLRRFFENFNYFPKPTRFLIIKVTLRLTAAASRLSEPESFAAGFDLNCRSLAIYVKMRLLE